MKVRLISSDKTTELTQGTDYTVTDRIVTLTSPTDLKIQIYRETTTKPLVGWADASVLRAVDMTVQSTQLLHLSEETDDKVQDGGLAKDTDDGVWDARYNRIKNLLDPQNPGDVVTLSYIVANQTSLLTQLKSTGEAERVSIVSTGDAQDKRLNDLGDRYVELMTSLKDTTVQKASEAEASADEAEEWANKAKASADKAGVSESNAKASEEEAKKQAEAADKSAKSAINSFMNTTSIHSAIANMKNETEKKANEAKESADKAAQSATEAAQFDPTTYVRSVTESEGKVTVTKGNGEVNTFNAGLNILARNKQYNVGDIAYSPNLPSYLYLECVSAGTTGDTEPDFSNIKGG